MKMPARKFGVLATVAMTVVAGLFAVAPEASAVSYKHELHSDDGDPGAVIRFAPDGDYVEVCDIEADGWGAQVIVDQAGPGISYTMRANGNGNCSVTSAATAGHDLKETHYAQFCVSLGKNGRYGYYTDCEYWCAGGTC
ncbi:MAG TPA: hypothetical protein VFH76_15925 [Kribbella sp.]|jgi:hypothetical protein|nr:hypothetical protein [Kribbella sp.]